MGEQYRTGWGRFCPFLGYHHIVILLIAGSIILTSVLSAGCTSEGTRNLCLASFSYAENRVTPSENAIAAALASAVDNSTELLEVRVGFLGVCAKLPSDIWACSSSFDTILKELALVQAGASGLSYDPLGIIDIAKGFKDNVIFDGLMFISVASSLISVILVSTFPGWHEEEDSLGSEREIAVFPSRPISRIAVLLLGISVTMTLLSVFWQHMASSNAVTLIKIVTAGVVQVEVGVAAMGLGWATFVLNGIAFIAMLVIIVSIRILSNIQD